MTAHREAPRRPDVTFVYKNLLLGGVQRRIVIVANELTRRGYCVDIVTTQKTAETDLNLTAGVRWIRLGGNSFRLVATFQQYLRSELPRNLISATPHYNNLALFAKIVARNSCRVIVTEESDTIQEYRNIDSRFHRIPFYLLPYTYRLADSIVAVSQGTADSLSNFSGIKRDRISVIYNGIYDDSIVAMAHEHVDHEWFNGAHEVVIGAGRLTAQKNFRLLIEAFQTVIVHRPTARLIILGEGSLRQALVKQINESVLSEYVHLPGRVRNPFSWFARARVFALSSDWEGFGNVVVEAMATGCSVVATDCPSGPAEILSHGRYGRLTRIGDAQMLARGILDTMADPVPRDQLIARARDFSIGSSVDHYSALLHLD